MKRKIKYFKKFYLVVFGNLVGAFVAYQLSFAMLDMINIAIAQDWEQFWPTTIPMIIYVLLIFPSSMFNAYARSYFLKDAMTSMKTDYMKLVFGKNINEFQKENNSAYVSALTNDFNLIETDYFQSITGLTESAIGFATGIIIFAKISPIILFVGLGIIVINGLLSSIVTKPIQKHNKERSVLFSGYSGFVKEVLSAFNIIKNNGLEDRVRKNFYEKSEGVQQKKYVIDKIMSFIFAAQNANFNFIFLGLMLFVSNLAIQGVITFAGIAVVATNIDRLIWPIQVVSESIPKIVSVKAIFKRIDETMTNKETHIETVEFGEFKKNIEFKNVTFAYDDHTVLKDINLKFEKGKKYLIIGPSGGGKSTVLRLLRKYFNPNDGEIIIDGSSLKDVKKNDYYGRIANIEQNIFLFEDTIRNNLTLYKDYSDQELENAIDKAGLRDFIESNPEGLDYMILDNGKNISGGEKSRIAIARGLINNANIIFLDEAFASLDRARVKEIETSLVNLKDVTIINVSHVIIEENKHLYDSVITVRNQTVHASA
ncbi:MAG: ABC transporter ATP-binding protein/permease [Firmicutes bacterium]|nr:ABC transporter ATP-binding protein/permease [Bacillota bacterium]